MSARAQAQRMPGTANADCSDVVGRVLTQSRGQALPAKLRSKMEGGLASAFPSTQVRTMERSHHTIGRPDDVQEREADRAASLAAGDLEQSRRISGIDLSAVRIHTGALAAQSAQALGAVAYTAGNDIVFGHGQYAPDTGFGRHVLAHEAAHVLQNSRSGDAATVRRYTAYSNSEQVSGSSKGWKHPALTKLRVSDDGMMAAEDKGWGPGTSQRAWTTPEKLIESNKTLFDAGSLARLRALGGGQPVSGQAPASGAQSTLQEIEPVRKDGSPIDLASDCGSAARQVMGSSVRDVAVVKGTGKSNPSGDIGAGIGGAVGGAVLGGIGAGIGYAAGGKGNGGIGAGIGAAIGAVAGIVGGIFAGSAIDKALAAKPKSNEDFLTSRTYHGGDVTTPHEWSEEVFKKEFGQNLTRQEALAKYDALPAAEKDAFDKKYGINKYAVPRVGQGVTIATEYDMPGYSAMGGRPWNFHYAAAVLSSGADYITLESAAGWKADQWIFFMYGPETKAQSFHEEQRATGTHGNKNTSMVVQSN